VFSSNGVEGEWSTKTSIDGPAGGGGPRTVFCSKTGFKKPQGKGFGRPRFWNFPSRSNSQTGPTRAGRAGAVGPRRGGRGGGPQISSSGGGPPRFGRGTKPQVSGPLLGGRGAGQGKFGIKAACRGGAANGTRPLERGAHPKNGIACWAVF